MSAPSAAGSLADARADRPASTWNSWKRWHSVTGVFPVGLFLALHLWTNARALQGEEAYRAGAAALGRIPLLAVVEVVGILLPLAYHALYGVYLAVRRPAGPHPYATDRLYLLERVSGMAALAFLLFHLGELPLHRWLYGLQAGDFYQTLESRLSATYGGIPWTALAYLLGLTATVFHFANGLAVFWTSWGYAGTPEGQARAALASWGLGAVLYALGIASVLFFATGSRLYPGPGGFTPLHPYTVCAPDGSASPHR